MTRLDDLLGYDDAPRRPRRTLAPRAKIVLRIVLPFVIAYLLHNFLRVRFQVDVPYVFLASTLVCLEALRAILSRLKPLPLPAGLRDAPSAPSGRGSDIDGIGESVMRWTTRLDWHAEDFRRFEQMVKPALVDIVDERLRVAHGVSRAGDPQRARAIVPAPLWSFIHEPMTHNMNPQEIATLVAQMEAL